ncbi:peptide-N4-(N-acetyl-beta- glucosaminyl)asparagine amidase [Ascosphaera pollenicola]|nr:peptide-N4-(N-acetyl-beta- glucosaminyl)asparagine amidase [Ascosphaera pollenicola]
MGRSRNAFISNVSAADSFYVIRRTGITLREGEIGEDGMENLEGMFSSSPEPAVQNHGNATVITSEDMEIGGSSAPDPADVLADQRQHRENYALPPRSRSPRKTFLSGSPRRTPILHSSPNARNREISSPIASRMAANKPFNGQHRSAPRSNLRHSHVQPAESQSDSEPETLPHQEEVADFSDDDGDDGPNIIENEENDESLFVQDNNDYDVREEDVADDNDVGDEALGGQDDQGQEDNESGNESAQPATKKPRTGTKPRTQTHAKAPAKQQKSRSNTRKASAQQENHDEVESKTTHRSKTQKPAAKMRQSDQPALPNGLPEVVDGITSRNGRNKSRSLYILKREEPRDSAQRTRSGRVSVRPLAYWRNERCVYGEGGAEIGQRFPLSTIKEVIRTEEPEPEKSQKPGKRKRGKGKSGKKDDLDDTSEDEANVSMDPWETRGGGVFYGPVRKWDNEEQKPIAEEEVVDLAYAPVAVQTHPVKDASFSFAKILSTPFLGSGFVDMPAGSIKRTKNSKKMHMVFYMIHGRIQIEISGLQFNAGKGTVFQVPRGNDYSFKNNSDKPAKLFFTQGCVASELGPARSVGNIVSSAIPSSEAPEPETTKAGKKPATRRGRPRKQAKGK